MKTILYYFTGTGNSLAVAEGLARHLGDCNLVPIATTAGTSAPISPAADHVGIVCPVYFFGLPAIVADFSRRIDLARVRYVFAVVTMGGSGGSETLRQLDRILNQGPDTRGLDAGFTVKMPGNYIIMYGPPKGRQLDTILGEADRRVEEIGAMVNSGVHRKPSWSPFASIVHRVMYPRFIAGVHEKDRKFTVDDRCTSCGTCAEVCPVGNVRLEAGRPVWLHHCEQCMACIHLCPTLAVQAGPKTEGRERYRHPGITIKALKEQ
jgi:ferredoxin